MPLFLLYYEVMDTSRSTVVSDSFFNSIRASGSILLVLCLTFVAAIYIYQSYFITVAAHTIHIGDVPVRVEIADTELLRGRGLSGHAPLKSFEGMLFLFQEDGYPSFWMKDMLFPIDIVWISREGRIVHAIEGLSPDTYPTTFKTPEVARYVLELPAGFLEAHRVKTGDFVEL